MTRYRPLDSNDDLDNLTEDRLDGFEDEDKELFMPETIERKPGNPASSTAGGPERTPGVYVRSQDGVDKAPHELDMLWTNSRHFVKEDRSPVVFTAIGLIIGAILTAAVFYLMTSKPTISVGENDLVKPVTETELVPPVDDPTQDKARVEKPVNVEPTGSIPALLRPLAPQQQPLTPKRPRTRTTRTAGKAGVHVVQGGDTLEQVARRFYGTSSPALIEKIQRANNMDSPHRLSIGQKLVVPPSSY